MNKTEAEKIFNKGKELFDELSEDMSIPGSYGEFVRAKWFLKGYKESQEFEERCD